jgi:hypothetical protein
MKSEEVKAAIGYERATERDRCSNCKHCRVQIAQRSTPWLTCGKHGFMTSAGAICAEFETKKAAVTPPPL